MHNACSVNLCSVSENGSSRWMWQLWVRVNKNSFSDTLQRFTLHALCITASCAAFSRFFSCYSSYITGCFSDSCYVTMFHWWWSHENVLELFHFNCLYMIMSAQMIFFIAILRLLSPRRLFKYLVVLVAIWVEGTKSAVKKKVSAPTQSTQ